MENKIKLIDVIVSKHPSYGVEKGWSEYTGGMTDSGHWYYRKMLDVPIKELQVFLDTIIEDEKPKSIIPLTEQELIDSKIMHYNNGCYYNELFRKRIIAMQKEIEYKLLNLL